VFQLIRIRGVGVIEDAVLELSPGLNVLTGETGAGKTMVVSGLGLLLGARADSALVRESTGSALVEGIVALAPEHPARRRAALAGAEGEDELVLARTLTREGRSRAHVGGRAAPVGLLSELGEMLVAVHGQADQWRLRRGEQHREVLDGFGGAPLGECLTAYQQVYDALAAASRERDRLRGLSRERARDAASLQAALEEIGAVDPKPGEDEDLRAEDARLAHANGLRAAAEQAHGILAGDDGHADGYAGGHAGGYAGPAPPGVSDQLAAARSALAPMTGHDRALDSLGERVAEVGYLLSDVSSDLATYLSSVEVDPARLAWVQQRRAALSGLLRKYGETTDEVLAWAGDGASRLAELLGAGERVTDLERETDRLRDELGVLAVALRAARVRAAHELGSRVTGELRHLAMGRAEVTVSVRARTEPGDLTGLRGPPLGGFSRHGADEVEIMLAANPGSPARSVARTASGGELSRVMLALEVVTGRAGSATVPTFVFDEVDAGVGGRAALDVGARLAALAAHAQVIVVTHLAQVAAFADRHLVVRKDDDGVVTSSSVTEVAGDERLRELSRMMGGDAGSSAGLEHARELLAQARGPARDGNAAPGGGR